MALMILVSGCGGGSHQASSSASTPTAAEVCVGRWNAAAKSPSGEQLARVAVSETTKVTSNEAVPAKVSAGFAQESPKYCLVTTANPVLGFAQQWQEVGPEHFQALPLTKTDQLPPSATEWNAHAEPLPKNPETGSDEGTGTITVGAP